MLKAYFEALFVTYRKYAKILLIAMAVWYGLATAVGGGIVAAKLVEPMVEDLGQQVADRLPLQAKKECACQMSPQAKKVLELAADPMRNKEAVRNVAMAAIKDLSYGTDQARVVPSFKDGQPNGIKMFSIQPDSLFSALGIKNGDVLTQINGYSTADPEEIAKAYAEIYRLHRPIQLAMLRRGEPMTLNF